MLLKFGTGIGERAPENGKEKMRTGSNLNLSPIYYYLYFQFFFLFPFFNFPFPVLVPRTPLHVLVSFGVSADGNVHLACVFFLALWLVIERSLFDVWPMFLISLWPRWNFDNDFTMNHSFLTLPVANTFLWFCRNKPCLPILYSYMHASLNLHTLSLLALISSCVYFLKLSVFAFKSVLFIHFYFLAGNLPRCDGVSGTGLSYLLRAFWWGKTLSSFAKLWSQLLLKLLGEAVQGVRN